MPEKKPAIEGYQKALEKLSGFDINAIVFLLFLILIIILAVLFLNNLSKKLKAKYQYSEFVKYAKEKELSDEQISILWNYSKKMGRDPFLALEFKSPFEKVIDLYIKDNPNFDENLIKGMREKLGFDVIPSFVPITVTKDIDLFQEGRIKLEDGRSFNVILYDKDELYMYWAITDKNIPNLNVGDRVKISFTRKSDGAYIIEGQIEDILKESGTVILKIPHTFEILRTQRREYPRVDTDIEAVLGKKIKEDDKEIIKWYIGRILDISPSGARFCVNIEEKNILNLRIGDEIILTFTLEEKDFQLTGEVVNIYEKQKIICYGIKFKEIKESVQKDIFSYVRKEQQKMLNLYKKQS
ncbi:MAG: PilZ domain-containing protein [Sulfurihydrogenibium sp.]|jgi:c-di-GMP-binding flagellar brake protein YcgR|nr:PilZ domain-containing protein [Sulfurihydrogenibium sp.]